MARTLTEIKKVITQRFMGNEVLASKYGFIKGAVFEQEFSKVSLENIMFEIVAFAIWTLEQLFDNHKSEVNNMLAELKPHTARWYRSKALNFQYGHILIRDTDKYDNKSITEEQIEKSKIIKYSAITEPQEAGDNRLVVKIATEQNGELSPILESEQKAFTAYIQEIKDAGVRINVINYSPDILQLSIDIYRDPMILDENGNSRLNGGRPVELALREFMKELPFNGELRLQELSNKLEIVEGVQIVHIVQAQSKWLDSPINDSYGDWENIDVRTIPKSGYFKIESFVGIKYKDLTA